MIGTLGEEVVVEDADLNCLAAFRTEGNHSATGVKMLISEVFVL